MVRLRMQLLNCAARRGIAQDEVAALLDRRSDLILVFRILNNCFFWLEL